MWVESLFNRCVIQSHRKTFSISQATQCIHHSHTKSNQTWIYFFVSVDVNTASVDASNSATYVCFDTHFKWYKKRLNYILNEFAFFLFLFWLLDLAMPRGWLTRDLCIFVGAICQTLLLLVTQMWPKKNFVFILVPTGFTSE